MTCSRHRGQAARSGFTLLEMLVALTMMAVLFTAIFASLSVGFRVRRSVDRVLTPVHSLASGMELIRAELRTAMVPSNGLVTQFVGEDDEDEFGRESDRLVFFNTVTYTGWPGHRDGVRQVELLIGYDRQTGKQALIRRITENTLAPVTRDPVDDVLCRDVKRFNLRYFDGSGWVDSWNEASADGSGSLPRAVEVTLELMHEDEEAQLIDPQLTGPLLVTIVQISASGAAEALEGNTIRF